MTARRRFAGIVMASVAVAAGCSSGSSAGAPRGGSNPVPSVNAIDRTSVDTALSEVLHGLRALSSLPRGAGPTATISGLNTAATDLTGASGALDPPPHGVPPQTVQSVSGRLASMAGLIKESSTCLVNANSSSPSTSAATCAKPLRQANSVSGQLARALISLAAYSSQSPTAFEQSLVTALHG